jgi:hypothetical protein
MVQSKVKSMSKVKSQSHVTTDSQSISMSWCLVHLALKEIHPKNFNLKHAVQRGIWVPTQHLLWDQGKPWKTLIELAGRRTFRMQTDF